MAEAQRGRKHTPEHRAKVAAGNRGKKMSPESIAKSVAARAGLKHTPEAKAKIRAKALGRKGWIPTSEELARRAEAIRAAFAAKRATGWVRECTPEVRAKISASSLGLKRSAETRAKMSEAQKVRRDQQRAAGYRPQGPRRACPLCGQSRHRQSKTCRTCYLNGNVAP